MDLLNLGAQSRKTGFKPKKDLRKDKYNMEDIDEFFAEDDEEVDLVVGNATPKKDVRKPEALNVVASTGGRRLGVASIREQIRSRPRETTTDITPPQDTKFNNFARKINFTDAEAESFHLSPISLSSKSFKKKNAKSPLRSPLQENNDFELHNHNQNDYMDDFAGYSGDSGEFDDDYMEPVAAHDEDKDMSLSPVVLSPIKVRKSALTSDSKVEVPKSRANVSKESKAGSSLTKKMALGSSNRKRKPPPQILEESQNSSQSEDTIGELLSPPSHNKRRPRIKFIPKETITRPSPLPSPPPDGLRRSKRVKIPPLAYWRNERIVYTRANEEDVVDPDTTLAKDIENIPLQEIKEVVHIPEAKSPPPNTKKRGRPRKNLPPKLKKAVPKQHIVYDYESDPEISGSEWFGDKHLDLRVFEGPHDERVTVPIAWAPNEGDFEQPPNTEEIENFKVATLFGNDRDFTAGGLIEFPYGGFKSLRNSSASVYIFHVIKGLLEVTLNDDKFVVTRGCSFQVPRSNNFAFKNLSQDKSKLFFVQSKKVVVELNDV